MFISFVFLVLFDFRATFQREIPSYVSWVLKSFCLNTNHAFLSSILIPDIHFTIAQMAKKAKVKTHTHTAHSQPLILITLYQLPKHTFTLWTSCTILRDFKLLNAFDEYPFQIAQIIIEAINNRNIEKHKNIIFLDHLFPPAPAPLQTILCKVPS